jgi:hypothetical protein
LWDSARQRRRLGRHAVRGLEPEYESSHPVLLSGAGRRSESRAVEGRFG